MEVHDIVQEVGIKTIPKKKKCKKAKWLSEEALEIAVKRRDVKGKGEKERYTHLDAEFQRLARRGKKAFLCDQCKEIEPNIYIVICKVDSQGELAVWCMELSLVLCDSLERWDAAGDGGDVHQGADVCVTVADSCWYMAETHTVL